MSTVLDATTACEFLYASHLQPSDKPTPEQVRTAIEQTYTACAGDCGTCIACLALDYGRDPDSAAARMRWCRAMVATVLVHQVVDLIHAGAEWPR